MSIPEFVSDKSLTLHGLFEAQVEKIPEAIALVLDSEQLTYRELNEKANQLAHYLSSLNVASEMLVGICLERSIEMIVGMLGILKAGAAFVPLDPSQPQERLAFILADTKVEVLLTLKKLVAGIPLPPGHFVCLDAEEENISAKSKSNPVSGVQPKNLAYTIYTSGSTGQPKGVMVSHRAICQGFLWMQEIFPITQQDRILQKLPLTFDFSFWELFWPLMTGARVVLAKPGCEKDPAYLVRLIAQQEISVLVFVPSVLQVFLSEEGLENCRNIRMVFTGGEPVTAALKKRFFNQFPNCRLYDLFGATENIVVAYWLCKSEENLSGCPQGRLFPNLSIYVVDEELQPVPEGEKGELLVGGWGLARGYLNRPELTTQKFISNPFQENSQERFYRTGDLVRYLGDDTIEILGRIDHQVKIRGFRIELGEIEEKLSKHPSVKQAAITAREDVPGDKRLVAYLVLHSSPESESNFIRELRQFLQQQLPDYMIPSHFVVLESLPLNPNGKVNRRALPKPEINPAELSTFVAPRTAIEEILAGIWAEILRVERVGVDDNFFELGGHSLLAAQIIARIRDRLKVELPFSRILESPTVAGLALIVEEVLQQEQRPIGIALQPISRNQRIPLSFSQEQLWFLAQVEPNIPVYNEPCTIRFPGAIDVNALEKALNAIINRHESLRTRFMTVDGQPAMVIDPFSTFNLAVMDLRQLPEQEREAEALRLAKREAIQPFDFSSGLLLRAALMQLSDEDYRLFLTFHHIITDAVSLYDVFLKELATLYKAFSNSQPSPLAELPIQYADFAVWQRQWFTKEILESRLNYWKQQLADLPVLQLPLDRPRPPVQTFRGARQCFALSKNLTETLKALSRQEGVTLYTTLLTAFKTLLYRYSGQEDIVVGTVSAGRNKPEIEGLIGFFVNTLVLRTNLSGNPSFQELLSRVQEVTLAAYAHEDLPFEKLVEILQPERNLSQNPLFQVAFTAQPSMSFLDEGWTLSYPNVNTDTAKFDLTLDVEERLEGIIGQFEYNTDLFEASTIARMAGHYQTLLEALAVNSDQPISKLSLLTQTDRYQLLVEWNNTEAQYPFDKCIHQLFEEQVERSPDAVAVVFEGEQLTYRELNIRANQLAHYLQTLGVGPEVLVGICVERSSDMIIGLLGVLKAGGAYVPIDPAYPTDRISYMLDDSRLPVLLTQQKLVVSLPEHQARVVCLDSEWQEISAQRELFLITGVTPENLAYVIYTSGSTGKPKGVLIPHSGLLNLVFWHQRTFEVTSSDRATQLAGTAFDASVWEVWPYLASGASIYLVKPEILLSTEKLRDWLLTKEITITFVPTPIAEKLLSLQWPSDGALRIMLTGGDKLHQHPSASIPFKVVNNYGPTENTVVTTSGLVESDAIQNTLPHIGRPIDNIQVYLLDRHLQPVPIGVPGELYIASVGLARGYLNRPDLTQEKFIPNTFSNEPGSRLYKTGDLGRYLPDGNIEFLGRIDNQVKIRGFRIELGEIEAILNQHSGVRETAVIAKDFVAGDKQLVAYVVPYQEGTPTITDLRHFLKQKLPDYMMPGAFIVLEALPLTPNGKVDRRALPAPDLRPELEEFFVAPRTPIEEMLASIWSNILLIDSVGVHDNFFTLGGHSLLATQVISRVRDTISIELPLRSLFEAPTIAEFASRVEIALKNGKSVEALPLLPIPRSESIPLSFAQARLWFLDQLQPESAFYNIPLALHLSGQLNIASLQKAINEIIRRHEALRTNFAIVGDQPVQVIASTLSFQLPIVNLLHLSESEREIEAKRLATVEANRPFNLEQEPLLRGIVLQLGETEYLLLLTMHHIISDGWSLGVFVRELTELYQAFCTGKPPVLPELPVQYADFALWQRQWLTGEILETQLHYWKEQLKNAPNLLELPTDRARSAVQTFRGGYYYAALSKELSAELATLSKRAGVTMFMTLLAAFQTFLYRYSGEDDIVVGTPVAGRNRRELERLIGFFVNTLVLRTNLGGNPSFEQLLNRVREVALQGYTHQDLPFEQLVEALQPTRNLSYTPLFQVMFALDDGTVPSMELLDLAVSSYSVELGTAKFDLTLSMENTADGLVAEWEYNSDLFDETTIVRMAEHFQTLLEGIVANSKQAISELPLLTPGERQQLLVEWNNTAKDYPQEKCIHQLFEEQVERTPDAVAVVFEEKQLTYRELNVKANQLAHYLQSLGLKPEVLVGICVERSLEMVIGLLGILKTGGAYVPLDPAYPKERLAFMVEDSSLPVLLTQEKLVEKLPAHSARVICLDSDWKEIASHSEENLSSGVKPENLAYVIYTSGSTGKPKGVLIQHESLVNYTTVASAEYEIDQCDSEALLRSPLASPFGRSADRILQFSSISFDVSAEEIYTSLISGATLVLRTDSMLDSIEGFLQNCKNWEITVMALPTAYWHELTAFLTQETVVLPSSLRLIIIGGEKALPERLKTWLECVEQRVRLVNNYGPTEATVGATIYDLSVADTTLKELPIGRPLGNVQTYILDRNGQPVPVGVPGELHIGGAGLARGYLNQPNLTDERFIRNSFSDSPTSRLYKTGDLVRYLPDGNIEYLGRIDNQVKIRGFRIEIGEIEQVLAQYPDVQEAVVVAREDIPGNKRLVAYIVSNLIPERVFYQTECVSVKKLPEEQGLLKTLQHTITDRLRDYLKQKLPDYMIPSAFVLLEAIPLTPNGKLDRRALIAPDSSHFWNETCFVDPHDTLELQLSQIWSEVLGVYPVGVRGNFFTMGGHSLLAVRLMARLEQQFGTNLPLATLFSSPTIEQLAIHIRSSRDSGRWSPLIPIHSSGSKKPFFCVPGIGGNVLYFYDLARHLGSDQPFYGLQARGLDGESEPLTQVEDMAAYYIQAIQTVQSQGPYLLGGHSFGGLVVFEIAQQLQKQGHEVALVAIIDAVAPIFSKKSISVHENDLDYTEFANYMEYMFYPQWKLSKETFASLNQEEQLDYLKEKWIELNSLPKDVASKSFRGLVEVYKANTKAHRNYYPEQVLPNRISVFRASEIDAIDVAMEGLTDLLKNPTLGWSKFSTTTENYLISGNHMTMMQKPHVQELAAQLKISLDVAQSHSEEL
ncbi:amino acid adenylation domain-containing protein [Microcoleus sp. B13-B4]|uniref:amino acid adenylation domain-containing protein n=1 Tax=Microcoleus sp. B13-B4 TaxID=2818651 RepID=UPI002FD27EAF